MKKNVVGGVGEEGGRGSGEGWQDIGGGGDRYGLV